MSMKSVFKSRTRPDKMLEGHHVLEYQCPCCKRWFNSWSGGHYNEVGVKLHLLKHAKVEIFERELGDRDDAPHFAFYKKSTVPIQVRQYPKRNWKI